MVFNITICNMLTMGIGTAFSAVIIIGIPMMMVFSLLPVYADNVDGSDDFEIHGKCNGVGWNGPFSIAQIIDTFGIDPTSNDRNENSHVCLKFTPNTKLLFKDDNPVPK